MNAASGTFGFVLLWSLLKMIFVVITGVGLSFVLAALERRESPLLVSRGALLGTRGALRAKGLSLVFVDAIKLIFKEDLIPPQGYRGLFVVAPLWALACALCLGATLPLSAPVCLGQLWQTVPPNACPQALPMQVIEIDEGLVMFVVGSMLFVFGAAMAGWSSRSKWALFSGLRHIFQTASYGVPVGLALLSLAVLTGSLNPADYVAAQGQWPWQWAIWSVPHLLAFLVLWTALVVGAPRTPFSLDDGRGEVIGALVEYSGMRAGLFRLAELVRSVFASALVVTVFFGAWHFPGEGWLSTHAMHAIFVFVSWLSFAAKVALACSVQQVARGAVVRPRPDQILDLVWRRLVPLGVLTLAFALVWRVFVHNTGAA
ncbi:MAG: NADH-quinone oxidoreductase subunit H [Deltaproteobacteria bacterium]|nr:NADH-quinone oxidoreductase subunit H [Deltaproteobacteria bacterium]